MYLVYIDDSGDHRFGVFSALVIPVESWRATFTAIKDYRKSLRQSDGIYIDAEFHATDFVGGRGNIAPTAIPKGRRCQIFDDTLQFVTTLPNVSIINATHPQNTRKQAWAWERLLNRVNVMMNEPDVLSHALIVSDEGKEAAYTKLRRKMGVYNPIPSRYGRWSTGQRTKNITIDRIIEDPVFKRSDRSYFIQLADFCAYALFRRERPIPSKTAYGLDKSFNILRPILNLEANEKDPDGIIRVT